MSIRSNAAKERSQLDVSNLTDQEAVLQLIQEFACFKDVRPLFPIPMRTMFQLTSTPVADGEACELASAIVNV